MSPEEQRIAIAKACGWEKIERRPYEFYGNKDYAESRVDYTGVPPKSELKDAHGDAWPFMLKFSNVEIFKPIPDYLNSLDAMNKAENATLESQLARNYNNTLTELGDLHGWHPMRASARRRAEALLKTLNLWTE